MSLRHLAWALMAGLCGCDGSLVDGSYHGEPLLVVAGEVKLVEKTSSGVDATNAFPAGKLRMALMWLGPKGTPADTLFVPAAEQSVTAVAEFPARYRLAVYVPPPAAAVLRESAIGPYALAVLAAYVDTNGNGSFERDTDKLVGGATAQRVVVYSPQGLSAPWLDAPIAAGYHRMVAQGAGTGCKKSGRVTLALDSQADTEVKVFAELPATLFPDVDCDGANTDFSAACPSPYKVATDCAKGKADPYVCANCPGS